LVDNVDVKYSIEETQEIINKNQGKKIEQAEQVEMLKKLKTIKNKQKTNLKELSDLREELLKFQEDLVEI